MLVSSFSFFFAFQFLFDKTSGFGNEVLTNIKAKEEENMIELEFFFLI